MIACPICASTDAVIVTRDRQTCRSSLVQWLACASAPRHMWRSWPGAMLAACSTVLFRTLKGDRVFAADHDERSSWSVNGSRCCKPYPSHVCQTHCMCHDADVLGFQLKIDIVAAYIQPSSCEGLASSSSAVFSPPPAFRVTGWRYAEQRVCTRVPTTLRCTKAVMVAAAGRLRSQEDDVKCTTRLCDKACAALLRQADPRRPCACWPDAHDSRGLA